MKVTALSDTHTKHRQVKIPDSDVLIFAGDADICSKESYIDFMEWFGAQKAHHKLFVAGNHDVWLDKDYNGRFKCHPRPFNWPIINELLDRHNITWLNNKSCLINGIRFYGSAMTPEFCGWAFMDVPDNLFYIWRKIPNNTQVVITHGPALGIYDDVPEWGNRNTGCPELLHKLKKLPNLQYHIHGHLHTGECLPKDFSPTWKTYNVSVVNEGYQLYKEPVTFDIESNIKE